MNALYALVKGGRKGKGKGGKGNCYNCGKPGHMARDCRSKGGKGKGKKGYTKGNWTSTYQPKGGGGKGEETRDCYNCGEKGHLSKDCPKKGKGKGMNGVEITTLVVVKELVQEHGRKEHGKQQQYRIRKNQTVPLLNTKRMKIVTDHLKQ